MEYSYNLYKSHFKKIEEIGKTLREDGEGDLIPSSLESPIEEERRGDIDQQNDDQNFQNNNICKNLEEQDIKKKISDIKFQQKIKYFLDGTLRTKYIGEYIDKSKNRSFPVIATEIASAVVERDKDNLKIKMIKNQIVFIFPPKDSGFLPDTTFSKLETLNNRWKNDEITNNNTNILSFKIEFLEKKDYKDLRYSMLGKARELMHKLEIELAHKLELDEDNWLVIDGALRKEEFENLNYTIGLAKSFSKKPVFKINNDHWNIARYLSTLNDGERSSLFTIENDEDVFFWYLRLRTRPPVEPLGGFVKIDISNKNINDDFGIVDEISAEIYALRLPSVYPYPRWPSFIYPIRMAEESMRSTLINDEVLSLYGNLLSKKLKEE